MTVHATRRQQAHDMNGTSVPRRPFAGLDDGLVVEKRTVLDGAADRG